MRRSNPSTITISDVAEKAGVSTATVSRFINDSGPVSNRVADRIERVMAELNYVPNAAAQQLASQKTSVIGLLIKNIHNDFFGPLLLGIESSVRQAGYNLLVAIQQSDLSNPLPNHIGPHNTDGMLVFADSLSDEELVRLHQKNYPMILIHRSPPDGVTVPSVTVENKKATENLVSHLITEHHRRHILFVRGAEEQEDSTWREIGYRSALEKHGLEFNHDLVISGGFECDVAFNAMNVFLDQPEHPEIDAVFTGDDDAAIGILNSLKQHDYDIPQDVSVAGFDDSRLSAFLQPALTTVRAPTEEVGREAVHKLIRILNNQPVEYLTLLPTEIVLRKSCGCELQ